MFCYCKNIPIIKSIFKMIAITLSCYVYKTLKYDICIVGEKGELYDYFTIYITDYFAI